MTEPRLRYACPACGKSNGLWQAAVQSGYYDVDEHLDHTSSFVADGAWDEEVDRSFGCSCGWEGHQGKLQVLDLDDQPVVPPIPGQLDFTGRVAA